MSYHYNYKFWIATADEINDLILRNNVLKKLKPTQDKYSAHGVFALLYSRYINLVNHLAYLFDQTCQVQKRALIQRLLEAASNRLLDLRNELKQIELSEFIYLDNALIKQKIHVDDIAILRPYYFPMPRAVSIQDLVDKVTRPQELIDDASDTVKSTRRITSRLKLSTKATILEELQKDNPQRYEMVLSANLIRDHEKARKARVFQTNIHYQPDIYRPKVSNIGKDFEYEFTHKPDQPMLILVKRTLYDSHYFVTHQASDNVDYYVRPVHRELKHHDTSILNRGSIEEIINEEGVVANAQSQGTDNAEGKECTEEGLEEQPVENKNMGKREPADAPSVGVDKWRLSEVDQTLLLHPNPASITAQDLKESLTKTNSFAGISKIVRAISRQVSIAPIAHKMNSTEVFRHSEVQAKRESAFDSKNSSRSGSVAVASKKGGKSQHHTKSKEATAKTNHSNPTEKQLNDDLPGRKKISDPTRTSVLIDTKKKTPLIRTSESILKEKNGNDQWVKPEDKTSRENNSIANSIEKEESSQMSLLTVPANEEIDQETLTDSILSLLNTKLKNSAARTIQAAWQRYIYQKRVAANRLRKLILYGMVSDWSWNKNINKEIEEDRAKQRNKKAMFDQQFIQVCEDEKARILKVRGPWIMEDISEHIRAWFREFYDGAGEFLRYPEEFEGGTILVLRGETITVPEYLQAKEDKKNKKKKSPEEKKKEAEKRKNEREKIKEQKRKAKALEKLRKKQEALAGKTYDFSQESSFLTEIKDTMKEYTTEWANIDEKNNITESPYMDWISLDKFAEVHQELRLTVDELMRVEFELLRKALAEDRRKKYKPQKKKKQKTKKGKRGKKGKKQEKDITADRSTESLYFEMEDADLFIDYPKTKLNDYIGEYNYSAYEKRLIYQLDPQPGQGEVKDVIREAIYGMGPLNLPKVKSICITGPPKCGKHFLINAIATELGAIIIDISPEKTIKFEEQIKYFIHLVTKMARILQPTILFINGCERIFWKKVPKDQAHLKPKLLGKYLIKQIVKPIKKEEKVIVIGLTNEPFKAQLGKMKKAFEKTILVPRADYGTTFQFSRRVALSKYNVPRDFEFSSVSMVTQGFASSIIYDNITKTLGIERRMKLPVKPLQAQELISGYLDRDEPLFPMTDDEYSKYIKFNAKVNKLAKQRAKFMKDQEKFKAKEKSKGKN